MNFFGILNGKPFTGLPQITLYACKMFKRLREKKFFQRTVTNFPNFWGPKKKLGKLMI